MGLLVAEQAQESHLELFQYDTLSLIPFGNTSAPDAGGREKVFVMMSPKVCRLYFGYA